MSERFDEWLGRLEPERHEVATLRNAFDAGYRVGERLSLELAADICEARARTLPPEEANEALKCAAAIRDLARGG